jgi:hypothetical protein
MFENEADKTIRLHLRVQRSLLISIYQHSCTYILLSTYHTLDISELTSAGSGEDGLSHYNVLPACVVTKAQSTKYFKDQWSALGEQMQHSGKVWGTLSTLLNNMERAQECLVCQVHTQSQERADVQIKTQEDGKQVSGLYAKSCREPNQIQKEHQKMAENTKRERKVAERKMKKDFEQKFKEFTRVLQTKLSDERMKRSVRSLAQSV